MASKESTIAAKTHNSKLASNMVIKLQYTLGCGCGCGCGSLLHPPGSLKTQKPVFRGHCKKQGCCNSALPHIYESLWKTWFLIDTVLVFVLAILSQFWNHNIARNANCWFSIEFYHRLCVKTGPPKSAAHLWYNEQRGPLAKAFGKNNWDWTYL